MKWLVLSFLSLLLLLPGCSDDAAAPLSDGGSSDGPVMVECDDASAALQVGAKSLPEGQIGTPYQGELEVSGGCAPYTFALVDGEAPAWLTIDQQGGLSGAPESSGIIAFKVKVIDASAQSVESSFTFEVVHVFLLTAFGPFGGYSTNPSWEAVAPLDGIRVGAYEIRTVQLPVEWEAGPQKLLDAIDEHKPTIIVSAGVADMLSKMRLESTAQNLQYGTDVVGVKKSGSACVAGGPDEYPTRLPLAKLQAALEPTFGSVMSSTAGLFLCNQIFYTLMHRVQNTPIVAGFIHTPPALGAPIASVTNAWKVVIETLITEPPSSFTNPAQLPPPEITTPPTYGL